MAFAFIVMTMLLGSSMMMAFVLDPSRKEPEAAVLGHRCQGESWQSIKKNLLGVLSLQTEPQLPAGALDSVREQWNRTFSIISHTAKHTATPAVPGYSASADNQNSASLNCCSIASEIFMKDLGWDSWVIQPLSLTYVQCATCNSAMTTVQCPSSQVNIQDANTQDQVPCCQPISHEVVPIVYMDESSTIVISSMELTRSCGCGLGNSEDPGKE
ncbi:gonadal somatic cell derived factor isoform X1 [Neolamprologus brichardi]|uniref:gonadal somatic cell derived factor isoform X1 n=1 Tax=Neolamprologus brichardi TaxID=32507 RepID=UPI0003EC64CB|nr:gonadal somatic cell derived factor isoform X1 [Neolamprologus brichardi]